MVIRSWCVLAGCGVFCGFMKLERFLPKGLKEISKFFEMEEWGGGFGSVIFPFPTIKFFNQIKYVS